MPTRGTRGARGAQAVAAIIYFRHDNVLYEHTVDPREVDALFFQKKFRDRVVDRLGLRPPIVPGTDDFGSLIGGRLHEARSAECFPQSYVVRPLGELPARPVRAAHLPELYRRFPMVPRNARDLLNLPPHEDATGGCRHCSGCIIWCPPEDA
ncbi:MAG: hypothetical protein WEE89_05460 [Gemmatimonadota bacterium]